jgi:5-methylcytosine-specific restriction endonuclease McrA
MAKEKQAPRIRQPAWVRSLLWENYEGRCGQCGDEGEVIDHYVPLARGGTNALANLWLLCKRCNDLKWAHTPDELAELNGPWRGRPQRPRWPGIRYPQMPYNA